jgi:hypothetical protein
MKNVVQRANSSSLREMYRAIWLLRTSCMEKNEKLQEDTEQSGDSETEERNISVASI